MSEGTGYNKIINIIDNIKRKEDKCRKEKDVPSHQNLNIK